MKSKNKIPASPEMCNLKKLFLLLYRAHLEIKQQEKKNKESKNKKTES